MRRALLFLCVLYCVWCQAQDLTTYKVETVTVTHKFLEGPVWSSHDGALFFSDIPANLIQKLDTKGMSVFRPESGGANGNALDDKGRLYTCEGHNRRVTRTDKKGSVEVLVEQFEGKKLNSPNDIAVTRNDHIYFTDPAFGSAADTRELPFYGVFHVSPKGVVTAALKLQTRPNGIAVSPDGRFAATAGIGARHIEAQVGEVHRGRGGRPAAAPLTCRARRTPRGSRAPPTTPRTTRPRGRRGPRARAR